MSSKKFPSLNLKPIASAIRDPRIKLGRVGQGFVNEAKRTRKIKVRC